MASPDRFKQSVVVTLARRAANRCSNPACRAVTSGPAKDKDKSVNVGVAAHIYGANPGSARFDPEMRSTDRADITNAIWLCANCHKMIDDDPLKYPAGLLFEWLREHERMVATELGKASAEARDRYETRHLREFGQLSYLAERIILEKDELWEYRLTGEVLRFEMAPILRQWRDLSRGLYVQPARILPEGLTPRWITTKFHEAIQISHAFNRLLNEEFVIAWGEPGVPGVDTDIVATCRLFAGACKAALEWEEDLRFTVINDIFDECQELMTGLLGRVIDEAAKLPDFMSSMLALEDPTGVHRLTLVLHLPEGWEEEFEAATARASELYQYSTA